MHRIIFKQTYLPMALFALLLMCFAGCEKRPVASAFVPITNGFGYAVFKHTLPGGSDPSISEALEYRPGNGTNLIVWPYLSRLWGASIQITNNVVVFIGGQYGISKNGDERLEKRIMAFKAPRGPAVDITDEILKIWADANNNVPASIIRDSYASLTMTNGAIEILFSSIEKGKDMNKIVGADIYGSSAVVPWSIVEDIIDACYISGKLQTERRSGIEFLRKE